MADKRIIEQTATSEVFVDDWLVKDSSTEGTTKIRPSNLKDYIAAGLVPETMVADEYVTTSTYYSGDICIYEGVLYKALEDDITGDWDSTKWDAITISSELENSGTGNVADVYVNGVSVVDEGVAEITVPEDAEDIAYDNTTSHAQATNTQSALDEAFTRTVILANAVSDISDSYAQTYYPLQGYSVGDYVLKDRTLYKCISPVASGGEAWNPDKWEEVKIADEIKEVNSTIDNLLIQKSIENTDIATFTDGSNLPMPKLQVGIEPQQDLHGYDSPWVGGAGKNKLPPIPYPYEAKTLVDYGHDVTLNGYTFSFTFSGSFVNGGASFISLQDSNGSPVSQISIESYKKVSDNTNIVANTTYSNEKIYASNSTSITFRKIVLYAYPNFTNAKFENAQLESGTTVTTFEPYENKCPISGHTEENVVVSPTTDAEDGQTHNIQFKDGDNPLIVYGATLGVVSGKLVVDRAYVDMGTLNYTYSSGSAYFTGNIQTCIVPQIYSNHAPICEVYKGINPNYINALNDGEIMYNTTFGAVFIKDSRYTDGYDLKTALNGVKLVYELATPLTYQLTPTQVKSLLGSNNVWCDTGRILKLEYLANATDVIASLDARITALENA